MPAHQSPPLRSLQSGSFVKPRLLPSRQRKSIRSLRYVLAVATETGVGKDRLSGTAAANTPRERNTSEDRIILVQKPLMSFQVALQVSFTQRIYIMLSNVVRQRR
jgi:hypothetical protein